MSARVGILACPVAIRGYAARFFTVPFDLLYSTVLRESSFGDSHTLHFLLAMKAAMREISD